MSKSINNDILVLYTILNGKLSDGQKKNIHFKSIRNFVWHLCKKDNTNDENVNFDEEDEIKKVLLEYLKIIEEENLNITPDYKGYVQRIGAFMMRHYGFSYSGGKIIFFNMLIWITLGAVMDFLFFLFFEKMYIIFICIFSIYYLGKTVFKYNSKKVFGYYY